MTDKYRVHDIVKFDYSDIGEYIDEYHTDRPLRNDILVKILNELYEENTKLHIQLDFLKDENQHMRDLVNENRQLKDDVYDWKASAEDYLKLGKSLKKENEQLKKRNNRQAKQLDNLYTLIEKQDWKTLTGIIQEFQECEEQLQKEWGTYVDE